MLGQQFAGLGDPRHNRPGKFRVPEMLGHFCGHRVPKFRTTPRVNAFVAYHCEFLRHRGDKNQNPIAFLRFRHPQLRKLCLRGRDGIGDRFARNEDPDLAGRFPLSLPNRRHDFVMPQLV